MAASLSKHGAALAQPFVKFPLLVEHPLRTGNPVCNGRRAVGNGVLKRWKPPGIFKRSLIEFFDGSRNSRFPPTHYLELPPNRRLPIEAFGPDVSQRRREHSSLVGRERLHAGG